MSEASLISQRPYLLRAMHEWMTDNKQTPLIVVDAEVTGVEVPRREVQNGKIILNISLFATDGLVLGNDAVRFRARFSNGVSHELFIPIAAVLGIYARETGQGFFFPESDSPQPPPPSKDPAGDESKRPKLKLVK